MKATTPKGELLNDVVELVLRDEARHVTFGINYLEEHLKSLSEAEREERARFAYEACVVARERSPAAGRATDAPPARGQPRSAGRVPA